MLFLYFFPEDYPLWISASKKNQGENVIQISKEDHCAVFG